MKNHFYRTIFDFKSNICSFNGLIATFLVLFSFVGISEMNAQTRSELGDDAAQQVIQIIQDEINDLEGSTNDIDQYLINAYPEAITDFEQGGDILDEFSQIIEDSDLLTQNLGDSNSGDDEVVATNPSVSKDTDELIGSFFNGIVISSNDVSGVNEAISRINELKNQ